MWVQEFANWVVEIGAGAPELEPPMPYMHIRKPRSAVLGSPRQRFPQPLVNSEPSHVFMPEGAYDVEK